MTDSWTSRLGATAFAVAPDAGAPSYGTVFDISNGQWQTSKQFQDFVQDVVAQTKANAIAEQNSVGSLHDAELRRAQQIENGGFDAEKGASWFHKILSVPKAAYNEATRMVNDVGGIDSPEEQWKLYSKSGGLLTKDEFFAFSPETQGYLAAKAHGIKDLHGALSAPGVEPLVQAVGGVYRATTAGAIMAAPFGMAFTTPFAAHPRYRNWFSQDQWAKAWREAGDESFGQALTNGALEPWVQQDTLDEWAKHNSLYQMTSFGVDLAASWYADPLVIGGKAVGATARLARHELPLSERSFITLAARQKLAGQDVTVKNPLTRTLGVQRANSMIDARPGVEELARNTTLSQFTGHAPIPGFRPITASGQINVFGNRTINREAAATALWHATRIADQTGDTSVLDLTWDAMHGNPNAWAEIQKRKSLAVQDLRDVDPSGQWETIHDAIEGTKTHAKHLEDYITDLRGGAKEETGLGPDFTDWYNQRLLQVKEQDLAAARAKLQRYDGYDAWYQNLIRENVITGEPQGITNLAQVGVPRSAIQGARVHEDSRVYTSKARRFLDNHYGVMHSVYHMPKAAFRGWKATTVDNTDIASGPRSFERQLANLKNLFGYENPDAMEAYARAWASAPDEASRIKVAADFEQNHVMGAVHQFYNKGREADQQVSYDTIMNVYKTVIRKQNEMHEDLNRRLIEGGQYAPEGTPGVAQMAADAAFMPTGTTAPIRVISHDKVKKQVEVELVDAGHVERYIVDEDKWVKKPLYDGSQPLFETQAPRYFHPIDAWRFHAELQQNPKLLKEIDAGLARQVLSSGEHSMDRLLQGFYQLWKPLTLWRLGWPLRVLMDENARALTILGPIAFMKNYGSAYYQSVIANSVVKSIDYAVYLKNWMRGASKIGPGPIREDMRRSSRITDDGRMKRYGQPVDRPVPDVPQEFLPNASPFALQDILRQTTRFREYERKPSTMGRPQIAPARMIAEAPYPETTPHVYDLNGRRVEKGNIIPLPHTETDFLKLAKDAHEAEGVVVRFMEKWASLLADKNYMLTVTPDDHIVIARRFATNDRKRAEEFLKHVHRTYDGAEMHDLSTGHTFHFIEGAEKPLEPPKEALQLPEPRDELAELDAALDDHSTYMQRKLRQRREYGAGSLTLKGSDGTTKEFPDAYAGKQGELHYQLVGSAPVIDYVSGGHGSVTSYLHGRQIRYKTVHAPEFTMDVFQRGSDANKAYVDYFGKWADMVNEHLGPSKVVQQIVAGKRDHEIADWLTKTEQGRRVARQILNNEFDDPMLYVMRVRDLVDRYVPNRELQRQMVKRSIKPSELRKGVANEDLPDLLAPEVEDVTNGIFSFRRTIGTLFDKMWNLLGTKPIDAFSRHPFYRGMYDLKLRNLAKVYKGRDLDENMIEALTNQAHTFALEQTQRYLWSLLDNTNFAEATRFIFPFWRAQREAMAKWAQIVFERPETVGRFMALNRIAYQHLTVLNQDGKEVGLRGRGLYGSNYHPTDRVVLQIPKALDKLPYFGQALRELGSTRIPIGSINTVLQGESPVLPGYGPTITIPVDKFLRWQSDTLGIPEDDNSTLGFLHKWLFPVGRPAAGGSGAAAVNPLTGPFWEGIISQLVPGWARRVQQTAPSMAAFNNYMTIRRQMEQDLIDQGRDPKELKDADVQKVSHSFNALRIFTSLFAPVQVEYAARDQMFLDEYHKFQKQYGIDAQEKFLEKYGPQYARFVTSSSTSDYGVPPTTAGLRDALKVRDLLAKYGSEANGGWGSLMISPESFDDYNQNAYSAEFQIPVSPASANKLRRSLSPEERARQAEEMSGWFEYRKINAMIQAEMSRRGLTSLNQSDASNLRELKRRIVEGYDGQPGLQQKYPAWAVAYEQGTQDIYSRVESLKGWVWDKRFDNRPDIKGVRQYLLIRKQVTDLLDQNYANGGSRNLNTEENRNTGLYDYFYNRVGQLVLDNPAFGEVYTRYLEGDTLEQGSKGYK